MRRAFATALAELAGRDRRILLLSGDLGYQALDPFTDAFPDRFLNAGVAEQNMVGMATGLAEAGYIPFCYSIATFASLRPYEFIRNGPVAHRLPVRVVGVGGGFEYGHNGLSHYALEDVGVMRVQPGLSVICPADAGQARSAVLATWDLPGPVYYRLGKDDQPVVPGLDGRFELGRAQVLREGPDVALLAMGAVATEVTGAADELARAGVQATVIVVASLNPAPVDDLARLLAPHRLVVTVEAHYVNGALGSLAAEVIAEAGLGCRLVRSGVTATPDGRSGSLAWLLDHNGISSSALVATVQSRL